MDADDLFGGLPAVSKSGSAPPPTTTTSTGASAPGASKGNDRPELTAMAPVTGSDWVARDGDTSDKRKTPGSSLVGSLGTAGTAMAFVPHAIRKKKKVLHTQSHQSQQHASVKQNIVKERSMALSPGSQSTHLDSISRKRTMGAKKLPTENENHADSANDEDHTRQLSSESEKEVDNMEPYLENEPESLRLLHASVTHPYDPHFPNDYLAYRERKKTEQVRKDLQRSALQRLDQQEKMRKKIEEERRLVMESGDLDRIVVSRGGSSDAVGTSGQGRGRGRGVANLPAWLVKKQQEQRGAGERGASSADEMGKTEEGQFDNSQ